MPLMGSTWSRLSRPIDGSTASPTQTASQVPVSSQRASKSAIGPSATSWGAGAGAALGAPGFSLDAATGELLAAAALSLGDEDSSLGRVGAATLGSSSKDGPADGSGSGINRFMTRRPVAGTIDSPSSPI